MDTLDEVVGQTALKDLLRPKIQLAKATRNALPHMLFCGEKEFGKLSFASAVAKDLGAGFTLLRAEDLVKPLDLTGTFASLNARAVLVITDVDTLSSKLLDFLTQAVSTFQVRVEIGVENPTTHTLPIPPFTFIGTTTKPSLVDERLRRCCIPCQFVPYTLEQAAQIALQIGHDRGLSLDEAAASEIATHCHRKPGEISVFLQRVGNHLASGPSSRIDPASLGLIGHFLPGVQLSPTGAICNKCGERKELVFIGCVCRVCSDSLDQRWARSTATDWVLVNSVLDIMHALKVSLARKRQKLEERPISEQVPNSYQRYLFRNTTYVEMKSRWATDSLVDGTPMGEAGAEETAQLSQSVPYASTSVIRPATQDEIAQYETRVISEVLLEVGERWGFGPEGCLQRPTGGEDNDTRERRKRATEETINRLGKLGFDPDKARRAIQRIQGRLGAVTQRGLSQVAGMTDLKEQLMHEVIGPFKDPELYRRYRVTLPNGILFYGPPGCGKAYIARSLAEELGWHFQYCRPSDVASPYIHDTVSRIRALFATAIEKAPSIVFIDEFEAFVPARSELGGHQQYKAEEVNEFLANLEGCAERKVLVIAATNEPEKIDPAVRRSGRFDKLILIPPPDAEARRAMLELHLQFRPVDASIDTAGIASILEGYSASDIKLLVDEAARMALKEREAISTRALLDTLERIPASITPEDMQRYSAFRSRGN